MSFGTNSNKKSTGIIRFVTLIVFFFGMSFIFGLVLCQGRVTLVFEIFGRIPWLESALNVQRSAMKAFFLNRDQLFYFKN